MNAVEAVQAVQDAVRVWIADPSEANRKAIQAARRVADREVWKVAKPHVDACNSPNQECRVADAADIVRWVRENAKNGVAV